MQTNYNEAKEDLKIILDQKDENVTYEDSLKQIVYTSKSKDFKDYHLDKEKLKVSIFLFLFFFAMMLIAGWKSITELYVLYAAGIGLLFTLVCSITKEHTIIVDFEKEIIRNNNKSIKFSHCKDFMVEAITVNFVPISYAVMIETGLGKVNFLLVSIRDKDVANNIAQLANRCIIA